MTLRTKMVWALTAALASTTACGQPPGEEGKLVLEPGSTTIELTPRTTPPSAIERSILEMPSIKNAPVVVIEDDADSKKIRATVVSNGANTTELVAQRFPNGKVHIERWVTEDAEGNLVNHGKYVEYDAQGNVVTSGNFDLGKQDGEWTKKLSLEQVQQLTEQIDKPFAAPFTSRAAFKSGKLDGDWTVADARGNPLLVWTYKDGERDGQSTLFNSKGEVVSSINYKHNLADGPAKIAGSKEPAVFTNGLMVRHVDEWYPAPEKGKQRAHKSQESQLIPVPYNVAASDWNKNKVDYQPTASIEPIKHGLLVTFYPNGQREFEGNYDRGRRSGTFVWWYPNGQQKTVGQFNNDHEDGTWTWWHENGMKMSNGLYVDGKKKKDEWSFWNEQGKLVSRVAGDKVENVAGAPRTPSTTEKR